MADRPIDLNRYRKRKRRREELQALVDAKVITVEEADAYLDDTYPVWVLSDEEFPWNNS